ncbi:hypothetical protein MIMGU_mgv11b024320mg [Erythranthe guttata]|uniref:Uncharacterized protein n=1 Tax=Erythranthe guttata TaxID=4155 RepID=A0A022R3X4_ERYGU|nr:hypothetical protein MIMGU_mgv11b024320mg [Erythranthe guttata]
MKIPATVQGHECASRNVHKNTRYKRYAHKTLIQINKHAQTHSLKWTCTNVNSRTRMRIKKRAQKHSLQKIRT